MEILVDSTDLQTMRDNFLHNRVLQTDVDQHNRTFNLQDVITIISVV